MRELLRNWRVLLLISLLILSLLIISFNGLRLGLDFKGGTQFQIHLVKPVSSDELGDIVSIISKRLDWTGLKDTKVTSFGNEFILAQIAETDAENIERIELLLKKQGKFEATLDGNVLFSGSDLIQIPKDPSKGYGITREGEAIKWTLPFILSDFGAKNFTEMTFHKCKITSFDPAQGRTYECEKTYFFIDRPTEAVLVIPSLVYSNDTEMLLKGDRLVGIPEKTDIENLLSNASAPFIVFDENLSVEQLTKLDLLSNDYPTALIHSSVSEEVRQDLNSFGFRVKEVKPEEGIPWIWTVTGVKEVISLSEDVTNMEPYIDRIEEAKTYSNLVIRGYGLNEKDAKEKLDNLAILLESGSLPIAVESISKETISPTLGSEFLFTALIMGVLALIVIGIVIYIRYRIVGITFPIIFTAFSEVVIILGFASLIKWNLDLAAMAGIIAAVGTGVDHQIIITDELIRKEEELETSFINRLKRAFFIIFAAAATTIVTMFPLILFSSGMGRLVGFAITTISGVLIGVFITRPAFGEIVRFILSREK
ncbi:MAG: hypothetical protein ABIE23_05660 [archaeon]